jgi:hypothetical protein
MTGITAQVSLYPLPQETLPPEVGEAPEVLQGCALEVKPDAVSTLLVGDDTVIFGALPQETLPPPSRARWRWS